MPRDAVQRIYADFKAGFVSEANPLQYPDGTVKDISNFNINNDGTLSVRPGLQLDDTPVDLPEYSSFTGLINKATQIIEWERVGGDFDTNLVAVQVGGFLYLFSRLKNKVDTSSLVDTLQLFTDNLDVPMDYALADGKLFFAHPSRKPGYIQQEDNGDFSVKDLNIKIRDTELWEGSTDSVTGYGHSKNSLSPQRDYNLRNGGWPQSTTVMDDKGANSNVVLDQDPVDWCWDRLNFYPSISIPFHSGKHGVGNTIERLKAFSPWTIQEDAYFGNTKPPVGRFIVDAESWERRGRFEVRGSGGGFPESYQTFDWTRYPKNISFYSQRIWYAGQEGYRSTSVLFTLPGFGGSESGIDVSTATYDIGNTIYFSQQLSGDLDKAEKCYQEADPTAETVNDLIATDGGTITIKGMGEVFKMIPYGPSLIVFAENGIWTISGVDKNSFTPTSYSVDKISNTHPISKEAIVEEGENIIFLSDDAIYTIVPGEVSALPSIQDISTQAIKSFYLNIPTDSKKSSKIVFDVNQKTMYMFYSEDAETLDAFDFFTESLYNKCLLFNFDSGSYYKYDLNVGTNHVISSPLSIDKQNLTENNLNVVVGSDNVVLGSDNVVLTRDYAIENFSSLVIFTLEDSTGTVRGGFSSFSDIVDLTDLDGDYTAFVETGFDSAEDIMRDSKKAPVIITHTEKTEDGFQTDPENPDGLTLTNPSSCLLSYGWDWATSYKNQRQVHYFTRNYIPSGAGDTFDYGQDVITTRTRIRGKGTSLGIRIDTESGKKCNLFGLGILYTKAQMI